MPNSNASVIGKVVDSHREIKMKASGKNMLVAKIEMDSTDQGTCPIQFEVTIFQESLVEEMKKLQIGSVVWVTGPLSMREFKGDKYLNIRVNDMYVISKSSISHDSDEISSGDSGQDIPF